MRTRITFTALTLVLGLTMGCSTWDKLNKTEKGAIIGGGSGAALGGVVGSGTGAVIGGAAGAVAGGVIGHEVEEDDEEERGSYRRY